MATITKPIVLDETGQAIKEAILDLKGAIEGKSSYILVNTTTYASLDDFLTSVGSIGFIYLYPIDISDTSKGYYQYAWVNQAWLLVGQTDLQTISKNVQITGNLTASGKISASEIVEDMTGYSITGLTSKSLLDSNNNVMGTITPEVVKISKNGNVLHLIWILKITATQTFENTNVHTLGNIFGITIPSDVANKITTTSSDVVVFNYTDTGYTIWGSYVLGNAGMTHKLIKSGNTLYLNLLENVFKATSSFTSNAGIYQRVECSILLNDNLVG